MDDFDKRYLDYILKGRGKVNYLSFLITINLAFYAAVFLTNDKALFRSDIRGVPVLLSLLLVVINFLISLIYLREHNLDKRITKFIKEDYVEKNIKDSGLKEQVSNLSRAEIPDKDRTWKATKCLLALVNVIPFSLLVMWVALRIIELSSFCEEIVCKIIANPFLWLFIIIVLLWILVCWQYDSIFSLIFRDYAIEKKKNDQKNTSSKF